MRQPLWLVNSLLALSFGAVMLFVLLSRPSKISRAPFMPEVAVKPLKKDVSKIDPSKIYTNDLFGTYQAPVVPSTVPVQAMRPLPQPPQSLPARASAPNAPRFLEPLAITLRGIIVAGAEDLSRAIIEDNKTKITQNYKVSDKIEDAQILRILRNKVVLIRSNGQQETLYMSSSDAQLDQMPQGQEWEAMVKKESEFVYVLDPAVFVEHIHSLAQLIDVLNLITVYRQGKSVGCRVGSVQPDSLGQALGLVKGDIITRINGIEATDTQKRFAIYKNVTKLRQGQRIAVELLRGSQSLIITYRLDSLAAKPLVNSDAAVVPSDESALRIMKEKYQFAPTVTELARQEKTAMLTKGSKNSASMSSFKGAVITNFDSQQPGALDGKK